MFMGQRRSELTLAEWQEINLIEGKWFIPAPKNKSNSDHIVYLSPSVIEFFQRLKQLKDDSNWVLPAPSDKEQHISERALTRAINRKQDKFGLAKWRPHDLRRTFVTGVNDLGTPLQVTEKIVNHTLEGMFKIYDKGDYDEQRLEVMLKWDEHLNKLMTSG